MLPAFLFDVEGIVTLGGLLALTVIAFMVFAESGLLFGFIFPGDSLLLAAGFFAAQGHLPIIPLVVIIVVAAILGDNVGYHTGRKLGPRVFKRQDGLFFRREYVEKAQDFYQRHGGKTIIIARFFPAIRTFAPIVAGVGKMSWPYFASYNVIGALIWGVGVTMAGYLLGNLAANVATGIENYLLLGVILVGHIIMFIIIFHIFSKRDNRQKVWQGLKEEWHHFFGKNR